MPTPRGARGDGPSRPRVGYVLSVFPVLSQTFIRREIRTLTELGVPLELIAAERGDGPPGEEPVTYLEGPGAPAPARLSAAAMTRLGFELASGRYHPGAQAGDHERHLARLLRLIGHLERNPVDCLHAPWADHGAAYARIAAERLGLPFSAQARAFELHRGRWVHDLPWRTRGARFLITNSEYNRAHLAALLPELAGRVHVVPNGLPVDALPAPRPEPEGPPRLLSVGRLVEQKGYHVLLEALARVRRAHPALRCELIGGAEPFSLGYAAALEAQRAALGLGEALELRGALPPAAVQAAYARCHAFVLPCVVAADGARDITPNVVMEAMAAARPVITTPVGALAELVRHGEDGWLVPAGAPGPLAEAIARLIEDPELRGRLGAAARAAALERFDRRHRAATYRALFAHTGPVAASDI